MKDFQGQVALVTGAGQGIGFEICRQLAERGASVLLNDINPDLTRKAAHIIREKFGECTGISGDAAEPDFIQKMVETAVEKYGKLTIAIANAGITLFGEFLEYSEAAFYQLLRTNLGGSFFLAQAAARQMIAQGGGGSLLFMSSVTGHQAAKMLAAYGMTKGALEVLAKQLVGELSAHRIRVNAIAPGATVTERTMEDPDYERIWSGITPLGRPSYPPDVAEAALFLVSEKAGNITGQTLIVDGGWTVTSPYPA